MRFHHTLLVLAAVAALPATSAPAADLLIVRPLDTAAITIDSGLSFAALAGENNARRNAASPAALAARVFHPHFGAAFARAARRIEVIDSSAAPAPFDDPDSSRFRLVVTSLRFTQATRAVARRTVPPSPPGFDPTTGQMTPGVRRAYSEGPGLMTTLTATAAWVIRDVHGDSTFRAGEAAGSASFRGDAHDARRADWDKAARDLALDLLRRTPFAPGDGPLPHEERP
jgi:hypothetical protein